MRKTSETSSAFQYPRHVESKNFALPSYHTPHKRPLCTLGGTSAKREAEIARGSFWSNSRAESRARHAQDPILCCFFRDKVLRNPHVYTVRHNALKAACMLILCTYQRN